MFREELCTSNAGQLICDKNKIVLCEDRGYNVETIKKECGIDITECLKELVDNLKSIIQLSTKTKYGAEPHELGIRTPEYKDNTVIFYGLYGDLKCGNVTISIVPKIGYKSFIKMLTETLSILENLGISLPTYYFESFIYSKLLPSVIEGKNLALVYSSRVLYLTRKFLQSYQPVKLHKQIVISDGEIGKPDLLTSLHLHFRGLAAGGFRRFRAKEASAPLIILKNLNLMIIEDLEKLIKDFINKESTKQLSEKLYNLINKHKLLLEQPVFRQIPNILVTYEFLKEALSYRYTNPIIMGIIKMYISYKRKKELLQKFGSAGLHMVSTHKLYEFWILASVIKEFMNRGWKITDVQFNVKSTLDKISDKGSMFIISRGNDFIKLIYDSPIMSKLITYLTGERGVIRPDIYLKFGPISYTIDAKYKYELRERDIGQALFYLSELSQPNLLAVIAYLGETKIWKSHGVTIKACSAHPERGIDISCLLEPILSFF
jgi:hypothetical protein